MKRVMIDIETLGLNVPEPNAVVWEIGLTFWDNETKYLREYKFHPDVLSQIMRGRAVDPGTVRWWREQPNCPVNALGDTNDVQTVLQDIVHIFRDEKPMEVWGNGPQFDLMLMHSLAGDFGMLLPWTHNQERDVRTLRKCFGIPSDEPEHHTEHEVLQDNRDQIYIVMRILNRINALPKDEQVIAQEAIDIERRVAARALNPNITWDNPDGPTAA